MGLFSRGPEYPVLKINTNLHKDNELAKQGKKASRPSRAKRGSKGPGTMKPTIPGFSKKAAALAGQVPEKYKPIYRKLFNEINEIYKTRADELNPKNGPDDNIPGEYNPELHAQVMQMEENLKAFVTYTKAQNEAMSGLLTKLDSKDEMGRAKYTVDDLQKIPKKLTREMG